MQRNNGRQAANIECYQTPAIAPVQGVPVHAGSLPIAVAAPIDGTAVGVANPVGGTAVGRPIAATPVALPSQI